AAGGSRALWCESAYIGIKLTADLFDFASQALDFFVLFRQLNQRIGQIADSIRNLIEVAPPRRAHYGAQKSPCTQRQILRALRANQHKADQRNNDQLRQSNSANGIQW